MARAKPTPFMPSGYSDWPIRRCIAEAVNVCRYSPWKAHEWMEEACNASQWNTHFLMSTTMR